MRKSFFIAIIVIALLAIGISGYVFFNSNKEIIVSFNTNSEIVLEKFEIRKGESINLPILERDGYKFLGWYLDDEKVDSNYKLKNNTVLNAKWEKIDEDTDEPSESDDKKTYTVTFDSNGGSKVASQKLNENEKVSKPSNPTRNGYTFQEWQLNGKKYDFNSRVTSNIILVAKWKEEKISTKSTYTVTFYVSNYCKCYPMCECPGSPIYLTKIVQAGEKITKPTNPTQDNANFQYWATTSGEYNFNSPVNSDLNLYGIWEYLRDTYTVTFNSNGGSNIPRQTVKKGEKVIKPDNPVKTNNKFIFKEWQLNGKTYDFNTSVTSDITLVAEWFDCTNMLSEGSLKVKFNTNGGNTIKDMNICTTCGAQQVTLPTPTKSGYVFDGWYADKALTKTVSGGKNDVLNAEKVQTGCNSNETTIYAKWIENSKKTYELKLINNTTNPPTTINLKYTCGTKIASLPTLKSTSENIFLGWFDKNNKEYKNGDTMPCSDLTLNSKFMTGAVEAKPVIYLYPEKEMDVIVKLGHIEDVTTIYPKYNDGWRVLAKPNGTLIDKSTGRSLYSLYWEGKNYPSSVTNEGFVIKGEDTASFLEEKLEILGLNEREAEEFIIYWLPQMEHNKYNYIKFTERSVIDKYMPLEITPKPDTLIRITMEFKPLTEKINVKEQKLEKVERKGFTAVEWGGSKINNGIIN